MSNPTPQQQKAIDEKGQNIIVSAGAGSGKTFVLKERVLKKIQKDHVSINDLIILTFTKKAANEMKERIRKILTENDVDDAKYIDSAYITTFDSYAHSLVNKYSYLLNIDKDFSIIDSSIVKTELYRILDEIFEEKYNNKEESFTHLINNLCYKNDEDLRDNIVNLYYKLTSIVDKDSFLNIDKYYEDKYIEEKLDEYESNIFDLFNNLKELYQIALDHSEKDIVIESNQQLINLMDNITTLDELIDNYKKLSIAQNRDGNYDDKEFIANLKIEETSIKDELKKYLDYSRKDLKKYYLSTKEDTVELKNILLELDKRINEFKKLHNAYEYNDIAFKAIELVRDYKEVAEDIKKHTNEILIDEYQDTNDIQDEFISYIANNNLYMVGDVKQSIYGFRNANPKLFKDKYDSYSKLDGGIKIDLTSNFRSRGEVINNINDMFSLLMYDEIGGADYKATHCMEHGNTKYDENIDKNVDYNLSILNYNNENKKYNKDLIDAHIIAKDILSKMNEHRHAFNDDKFESIKYKDFCILVDTSTRFDVLKDVLESYGIPAYISKGIDIKNDDEIYILKNLITCLVCIKNNTYKEKFKHAYASIARSYIYRMSDQEIYDALKNRMFKETTLFKKLEELIIYIDSLSNKEILYKLIDEFDIVNKTIYAGSIDERLAKLEYFIKQSDDLNKFGMDIYSMEEYFNHVISSEDDKIEMEIEQSDVDAVTIMTIHGSKGLEFNYVYMPYLFTRFSKNKEDDIILDKNIGLIVPFYDDGLDKTFMYNLYKQKMNIDTLSEKIRLFYVAITRAKEQFILVTDFNDKLINNTTIEARDLLRCNSFKDFVTLIKPKFNDYIKYIELDELDIEKTNNEKIDINKIVKPAANKLIVDIIDIDNKELSNKHFSKQLTHVMTQELKDILDLGTEMHACFEVYDFIKDNLDSLNIKNEYKNYIRNFLKHDEVKDIKNSKIYKEHEIGFTKDGSRYHGFIDLLIEYDDHFDIIDYKTNNIDSPEYKEQLEGYKDYIESRYNKKTNIYLYSIKKDIFKKL